MRPPALLLYATLILAVLASIAAGGIAERKVDAHEVAVGQPLRDALLHGLNGPDRQLAQFHGRALIINVWASWCGPCRAEVASLERLAWHDEGRHFAIIGISTDDYREQALAWLKQSNATISHYLDSQLQMEQMLGASRLPLTVLVDAQGRVRLKVYGARQWDAAESLALVYQAFAEQPLRK